METFIIYIGKISICLTIFVSVYFLFLRSTTFFRFNRFFLLGGFAISLLFPAIKYTYEVILPASDAFTNSAAESQMIISNPSALNIWYILTLIYLCGVTLLLVKNMYAFFKLRALIKDGIQHNTNSVKIIENAKVNSPFTIFNYIFIDTHNLSDEEKDLIMKHEITHINQKHWIDLLCSECMLMLQWFNPLVWVYVRLLKENHEFMADKAVLDSGASRIRYQAVLINQKFRGPIFSFSNSFNYSNPLNRLTMMKKAKSSPWKRIISLAIVPAFGLLLWASAEPHYVFEDTAIQKNSKDSVSVTVIKNTGGQSDKTVTVSSSNIKLGDFQKQLIIIDGVEANAEKLRNMDPNTIESMNVIKGDKATVVYGEKAKDGVIIIKTKEYVKNNPEENDIVKTHKVKSVVSYNKQKGTPVIYVDGKKIDDINSVDTESISSVNVWKGQEAIDKYGEEGKNGVMVITLKK